MSAMPKGAQRHRGAQPRRAPTLTQARVEAITEIIRGWKGRLTWKALCDAIERESGARYTRQALHNHVPIRAAYKAYREQPAPAERDKTLGPAERRIRHLQLRVKELEDVRDALLERFARWAVNAAQQGLDEEFLNRPLVKIDRAEKLR
jgi:hypothetical protein